MMIRKILLWIIFGGMMVMLLLAFFSKNKLNDFISEKMQDQTSVETIVSVTELIDSKYNYTINGLDYEYTLLEFGSTGCTICKQMETELDKVRKSKSSKINVIFLNTTHPENQNLVKFFGISAIPMQVMLDKNGVEFFKNYGFISAEDIIEKTLKKSINKNNI